MIRVGADSVSIRFSGFALVCTMKLGTGVEDSEYLGFRLNKLRKGICTFLPYSFLRGIPTVSTFLYSNFVH